MELLQESDISELEKDDNKKEKKKFRWAPFILLGLFLAAFIVFTMWYDTVRNFLIQYVHRGRTITWQRYMIYAVASTIIFIALIYMSGIPLHELETSSLLPPL